MASFRIHIVVVILLLTAETGLSLQRADRRAGYIPHFERIAQLESELKSARGANRDDVLLALAGQHFEQAQLYTLLWRSSAAIGTLYYDIMDENDVDAGIASGLYRGISYFELGMFPKAQETFESFLRLGERLPPRLRIEGEAWMGAVQYVRGNEEGAIERWRNLPESERTTCSVIAYVQARIGYNTDRLKERCYPTQLTDYRETMPLIQVLVSTEQFESLPDIINNKSIEAAFIERGGSEKELRYFNPSEIVTLSYSHYALAAYYAQNTTRNQKKRFYEGAFYFYTGRYDKAVDALVGVHDLRGAVYLAGAYYQAGKETLAGEIFDYLERSGSSDILYELSVLYAMLDVQGRNEKADEIFKKVINNQQTRSRRDVSQDIYKKLGLVYFYNGKYDQALQVLGTAFRTERRGDLRVNDPAFIILYGSSIVLAKNFISLSDAIDMFSTVMRAYPLAEVLVETTSLIDVVTNIGREGRVIYRR